MIAPKYTRESKRVANLERNYKEGVDREKMPLQERIALDMEVLKVSDEHLANLRIAAGLDKK